LGGWEKYHTIPEKETTVLFYCDLAFLVACQRKSVWRMRQYPLLFVVVGAACMALCPLFAGFAHALCKPGIGYLPAVFSL
jgi:hypothetical protein